MKSNEDLQKAIELLKRDRKVTRVSLQFEFNLTTWKARKLYEELRFLCEKGLAFHIDETKELICQAYHGRVELITLHRGMEHLDFDEDLVKDEEELDEEEEEEE
ncbi:hypothetical protein [Sulfuracidifex tepidarius]|uniref:hypothetical protein n=1 Tax=Sulfuracidifex tepidarius TaxID=1294262 RepID=UPI001E5B996E|nr:hypothetical protein [Sulfuracidifex tepidarius]